MTDPGTDSPVHFMCFRIITIRFPPCRQGNTALSELGVLMLLLQGYLAVFCWNADKLERRFRVDC